MPKLRQNERERAVDMVQVGITHQTVADHFYVSRITLSMLMIRLRQTDRTNDRPRSDRPRVTAQCQDRQLRLIHLWNRKVMAQHTAHITPGLANVRISGQTVRRRLRECGLRARRSLVGAIHMQRHRIARLARARARSR
jgi:transposase